MTGKTTEHKVNWAHSVLNDPGSPWQRKRAARAVLSKYDPEVLEQEEFYLDR